MFGIMEGSLVQSLGNSPEYAGEFELSASSNIIRATILLQRKYAS